MRIEEIDLTEAKVIQEGMRQVIINKGYHPDAKNEAFEIAMLMERIISDETSDKQLEQAKESDTDD